MTKLLNRIKYIFTDEYRIFHHPIYINLRLHRLIKDWYKCRKVFVKPKFILYKGDSAERKFDYYMYDCAKEFENKFFAIHTESLGWKNKWGTYVFTHSPEIVCIFKGKVRFTIRLEYNIESKRNDIANRLYWEAIINYLHKYNGNIFKERDNIYLSYINTNNKCKYYHIDSCLVPALQNKVIYSQPQIED